MPNHPAHQPPLDRLDASVGITPVQQGAIAVHEQYQAWRIAGFTRAQAFLLLRDMLHDYRMLAGS